MRVVEQHRTRHKVDSRLGHDYCDDQQERDGRVCKEAMNAVLKDLRALPDSGEVEKLQTAVKAMLAAVNPSDRSGISLFNWNERLKAASIIGEAALATILEEKP